jgi:hypothetical protein
MCNGPLNLQSSAFYLQLRIIRRFLRRLVQTVRYRRSLNGSPVLFANSFPKSGTHLLTQVLQGFPNIGPAVDSGLQAVVTFVGDSGRARTQQEILADLERLLPGDIAYGHLHALPPVIEFMCREGVCAYFILRDPRDVVVSHVHYVTEMEPGHSHHRYYAEELHSFDERLRASILGRPDVEYPFPDICQRFEPYLKWLERPEVLTLRFEDFLTQRRSTLAQVLEHALQRGFKPVIEPEQAISILEEAIDPRRSPTFRSGKSGAWREQFNDDNKRLFKDVAGELLIRLGYERDLDW